MGNRMSVELESLQQAKRILIPQKDFNAATREHLLHTHGCINLLLHSKLTKKAGNNRDNFSYNEGLIWRQFVLIVYKHLQSSQDKIANELYSQSLAHLLNLNTWQKFTLWQFMLRNDQAGVKKFIGKILQKRELIAPVYNQQRKFSEQTLQLLMQYQQKLLAEKKSNQRTIALNDINRLLTHYSEKQDLHGFPTASLRNERLRFILNRYVDKHNRDYRQAYQIIRSQLYSMLHNPQEIFVESSLAKLGMFKHLVDRKVYDVLVMLNYLGDKQYLQGVYLKFFSKSQVADPQKALNDFLYFVIGEFMRTQDADLSQQGINENRKYRTILIPFKQRINKFADKFNLDYSLRRSDRPQNLPYYLFSPVPRQHLTFHKQKLRKQKSRVKNFGKIFIIGMGITQGLLGTLALWSINPILGIVVGLATYYGNYYLYKNDIYNTLKQLVIKKDPWAGFTGFTGKAITTINTLAAITMAVTVSLITAASVAVMPFFAPAVGFSIASFMFVMSTVALTALMREMLNNLVKSIYIACRGRGISGYLHNLSQSLIQHWHNPTDLPSEQVTKKQLYLKRGEFILRNILCSGMLFIGAGFLVLTTAVTLGSWFSESAALFDKYFALSDAASKALSYIFVIAISGTLETIFNIQSFGNFSIKLTHFTIDKLIMPSIKTILQPSKCWNAVKTGFKQAVTSIASFKQRFQANPWKTLIPVRRAIKTYLFDLGTVTVQAVGAALSSINGHLTLTNFGFSEKITPNLSFLSENLSTFSCISLIMLDEKASKIPTHVDLPTVKNSRPKNLVIEPGYTAGSLWKDKRMGLPSKHKSELKSLVAAQTEDNMELVTPKFYSRQSTTA